VAVRDGATNQVSYLLGDQLGSTTVSANAAGGTPVVQRYLPYGAPRSTTGGSAVTDKGWIGQTKDSSTGLQFLNARYYDPAIGRFTAVDPIVDPKRPISLDRYGYGDASPVTNADPTGLRPPECDQGWDCDGPSKVGGSWRVTSPPPPPPPSPRVKAPDEVTPEDVAEAVSQGGDVADLGLELCVGASCGTIRRVTRFAGSAGDAYDLYVDCFGDGSNGGDCLATFGGIALDAGIAVLPGGAVVVVLKDIALPIIGNLLAGLQEQTPGWRRQCGAGCHELRAIEPGAHKTYPSGNSQPELSVAGVPGL
jgi:RHS repeat-associated protein